MKILKNLRIIFNITQEKLADKLNLDTFSISRYENGISFPTFQILMQITNIFQISFDYLILEDKCFYPRNLRLLKLAKKIDNLQDSHIRTNIESSAKAFLKNKTTDEIKEIKQDNIEIEFADNFHQNLKTIRNFKQIRQIDLAKNLNISAPLLGMYESKIFPSVDKLIKISEKLNISSHALATGEKLFFDFQDRPFGKTILLADQLLPLEEHKMLIHLMEAILQPQPA